MKAFRRWLIYRRVLNELAEMPQGTLAELNVTRRALHDFAWHCADAEAGGTGLPLAAHLHGAQRAAVRRR